MTFDTQKHVSFDEKSQNFDEKSQNFDEPKFFLSNEHIFDFSDFFYFFSYYFYYNLIEPSLENCTKKCQQGRIGECINVDISLCNKAFPNT